MERENKAAGGGADTAVSTQQHARPPVWRNVSVIKWVAQVLALVVVLALFWLLGSEAAKNFSNSGISFGWDWLSDPFGVNIREGIDVNPDSGARALVVGAVNTLRVAISGIIAATILGTIIGVARLSRNWIVNKLATVYIEIIRNIPLLVQIFFWSALAIGLAELTQDDVGEHFFKASNKGFASAWLFPSTGFWPWLIFVLVGLIVARYVARWRTRLMEETGKEAYSLTYAFGTVVAFGIVGWFLHPILGFLSSVWEAIGDFIGGLPSATVSIIIAVAGILGAAWWIRQFFESRRTPAGFGKLTDDDIFRVIFAGLVGLFIAFIAFALGGATIETPGGDVLTVAELIRNGFANAFHWLADKFTGEAGGPLEFSKPVVEVRGAGFTQFGTTGIIITPPFFAVWVGVTLYTASFIAEIVRGGILAVSKGQTEAAQAVGLRRSQYLRLIILPQAFRIILPPMGNQYLNLAKNTSLGLAVAFADIVAVGFTAINQTGQALPIVLVWMAFFVTLSLVISGIVNYYNRKLKLVER
ncbi:MAG: ABC transporter permease subunit [Acidimicrobiia bacterium]|nr:ABC transporter permease subunit [Acidimicrobiia bacterium]